VSSAFFGLVRKGVRVGIFKAYDIRGVYPDELNEQTAYAIGRAFTQVLGKKLLTLSRDMRPSSEPLGKACIEGITDAGVDVVDVGLVSTPANYFAIAYYGYPGGLQVTASHNPARYNGFKLSREKAIPFSYETGIGEVERRVTEKDLGPAPGGGSVATRDITSDYTEFMLTFAGDIRPMTIVLDAGNGMAGKMWPPVLEKLPVKLIPMYTELDGTFPNHEANPLKEENLRDVCAKVKEMGADLGIAADGDADRCVFIDERGEPVRSDLISTLIALEILQKEPGATIIYDPRSSWAFREEVEKAGGKAMVERVGHAYMKATLRQRGAAFGGELSGHYYFRDFFCADNGLLALIKVLNLLAQEGRPLSELIRPINRYFHSGEINFEVEDKDAVIEEAGRKYGDGRISHVDGITVEYDDWWFNLRKSNTEPLVRLNLEARSEGAMKDKLAALEGFLGKPVF